MSSTSNSSCSRKRQARKYAWLPTPGRLRDVTGKLRGAVTVLRDVTKQKRAHQALVGSEQLAQSIIRTALDAFVQTMKAASSSTGVRRPKP
jgi:hypothetical protein